MGRFEREGALSFNLDCLLGRGTDRMSSRDEHWSSIWHALSGNTESICCLYRRQLSHRQLDPQDDTLRLPLYMPAESARLEALSFHLIERTRDQG